MRCFNFFFCIGFALFSQIALNPAQAAEAPVANVFDIDGNGKKEPLSDGLLTLRYLFGFRGDALINQAIGNGATRTTTSQIETYLNDHLTDLDIDGNGEAKPLSDGLLLLRYLFGFRGGTLIVQALATDAMRITAVDIEAYIQGKLPVQPTPTGLLNDTGITFCHDYPYDADNNLVSGHSESSNENCANTTDSEGDPIPAGQDGHFGRDVTHYDNSDGKAGFSFTKLDAKGIPLVDQTVSYATTPWHCVKDNVTGLIWEVKTDDGELHDKDNRYTWYNPDSNTNGGDAGTENGSSDTNSYIMEVNQTGWCGANDWSLPTRDALRTLGNYGELGDSSDDSVLARYSKAGVGIGSDSDIESHMIDTNFFPNTFLETYWSNSPGPASLDYGSSDSAWASYLHIMDLPRNKSDSLSIRLVRSGQ